MRQEGEKEGREEMKDREREEETRKEGKTLEPVRAGQMTLLPNPQIWTLLHFLCSQMILLLRTVWNSS